MMETQIWTSSELSAAVSAIQAGQLVSFPSETVYGLGANAFNEQAVQQVYAAKGRPSDNPLIVHVADIAQVTDFALTNAWADTLMATFWPGPLTMILPVKPDALSETVTGGLDTVAIRMPDNDVTRQLIRDAGVPLVGPSANTSGRPSPTLAAHVYHDLQGKIAGVVDDGATMIGVESTIIDLSTEQPTVLRPGKITPEELADVLGVDVISEVTMKDASAAPKAPGMKYRHYAPDKDVFMVAVDEWSDVLAWVATHPSEVGLMMPSSVITDLSVSDAWSLGDDVNSAMAQLFAGLRHFDGRAEIQTIFVADFPRDSIHAAYNNRLLKASGGHRATELWTD
ncbi:Threonylcarbamoyl-AMP synthase [Weissella ceti]|uniref:Threonylcarbamoyl-AMP synthase n=3 Tax=Lactobacillaceae TaxID=33958 RepID=A0A075U0L2_9LACO|nr:MULTISPECIES: L-threonylcarbamoyladenylate synthase [Weissella]AIG66080.1 Threonylcarbamoyl-AMP synthase [Weissella tructae]AIM63459.1 Threonylcarbamoyl-AMP synthase [Weissella ceti]AIM64794.2 Threonylcarbamoyl-AMP synthase [Weissella ceti]QVV91231.1 threonylcarbamoyl-AMP synthase [Weissella tructae]